jgi:hypothetical protein
MMTASVGRIEERTTTEAESREVAEQARQTAWEGKGFMRDLFLGEFQLTMSRNQSTTVERNAVPTVRERRLRMPYSSPPSRFGLL